MRRLAYAIIALAVLISYYPTLYYPPRADQVTYLAEIANKHHAWDLIIGSYDLNRTRLYAPGDKELFRPLLYMLLGIEQVFFGHHFWAWQFLGILAHLALAGAMLSLLCHLAGPWLGFAGTWLFALSVTNEELVSWPHLTGYILMMFFFILTIKQVVFCMEEKELKLNRTGLMLLYLFVACFMYEIANIFTLCISVLLMISIPKNRARAAILLLPVLFYTLFSLYNYFAINHIPIMPTTTELSIKKYLWSIIYVSSWWLYEGIFNSMYGYVMDIRTMFDPSGILVFKPLALNNCIVILEVLLLFAYIAIAWINRRSTFLKNKILIALGLMLFAYVTIIILGRYQEMGGLRQVIRINSYYCYLFWVLVLIMAFVLIADKENGSKAKQWFTAIFVGSSLILGLYEGKMIYKMSDQYSQLNNSSVVLINTLDLLIKEKKAEGGFSFYVAPCYPGNIIYREAHKKGDPPNKQYTLAELLYPEYFRPLIQAKYKFLADEK